MVRNPLEKRLKLVRKTVLKKQKSLKTRLVKRNFKTYLAGAEGLEPSARGFGDRCSTN